MEGQHKTLQDIEREAGMPVTLAWCRDKLPGQIIGAVLVRCLDSIGDDWTADGADVVRG